MFCSKCGERFSEPSSEYKDIKMYKCGNCHSIFYAKSNGTISKSSWVSWRLLKKEIIERLNLKNIDIHSFSNKDFLEIALNFNALLTYSEADFWKQWLDEAIAEYIKAHKK